MIDTFNIVIIRQKIDIANEKRIEETKSKKGTWLSSWWGTKSTNEENVEGGEIRMYRFFLSTYGHCKIGNSVGILSLRKKKFFLGF